MTGTGPWPIKNQATQQEVSSRLLPITQVITWALPPIRSVAALDSHRTTNPTLNYAFKGSMLHAPFEDSMPDDLRCWGGGESLWGATANMDISSREVWLHRDHNKSIACRLLSKFYPRTASHNWAACGGRLYSVKWVDVLRLYSYIWWQALSQNPTLTLVHTWPANYLPFLSMPLSCTAYLSQSQFLSAHKLTLAKMSKTQTKLLWKEGKIRWWDSKRL